jgi:hypothetical protein
MFVVGDVLRHPEIMKRARSMCILKVDEEAEQRSLFNEHKTARFVV